MSIHPVLQKILDEKQKELGFIHTYSSFPPKPPSFSSSLRSKEVSIIAECKKGSPSAGILRADYDPSSIARIYEINGASAVSVLTDTQFFHGSIQDLKKVSETVNIPVLRKDFIIDESQIQEARFFGASAVLLIARILSPQKLRELLGYAHSLDLEVLVEVHTKEEAKMAMDAGSQIIGINTRDLDTFSIIPLVVSEIVPYLPKSVLKVGESGIHSSHDLRQMLPLVNSVLIGTYFMKAPDIGLAYQELLAPETEG